ncbi:hypothetical protein V8C86DRAFT_2530836, partial [Haematococcus lacustris]
VPAAPPPPLQTTLVVVLRLMPVLGLAPMPLALHRCRQRSPHTSSGAGNTIEGGAAAGSGLQPGAAPWQRNHHNTA